VFRKELKEKLIEIFGMPVSFDNPSDSYEQDKLFVEVVDCKTRPSGKNIYAKVTGDIAIFAQREKMPYGFFAKKIEKASFEMKQNLHFFTIDREEANSEAKLMNISERRASFVFLYQTQYDPAKGEINEVSFDRLNLNVGDDSDLDVGDLDRLRAQ
jgi:hypothetical protein